MVQYAIGPLLDMSMAYDRVNYRILLQKLNGLKIRGVAHRWFVSYLEIRSQYVDIEITNYSTGQIERIRSDRASGSGSIPLGSVLGCVLFWVYINDLPSHTFLLRLRTTFP